MTKSNRPAYRYQAGGSLRANDPTYVYRQADEALYDLLKVGEFCYVFNCRQMGKSSLGTQIMGRLVGEGICCVRVDLTMIGSVGLSMAEWYRSLIEALHNDVTTFVEAEISAATADLDVAAWQAKHEALMRVEGISSVRLFNRYLKEILLGPLPQQRFAIFIDEIDNVLDLEDSSDFFGLIRACFNRRADDVDYERLTFALFGVATPGRLIRDVNKTPFNLGQAIVLTGFELERSLVLTEGMNGVVPDPVAVLREILAWTGGQPFLTQKLCDWVQTGRKAMPELVAGEEAAWVEQLVQQHLIANWQFEDEPQHFRTIENFILRGVREGEAQKSEMSHKAVQLLGLYQQVLQEVEVEADESEAQTDLCLSGLVVRDRGKLRVYNRIYQRVFDLGWVSSQLQGLRPYSANLQAWLLSNCQDDFQLLRGQVLAQARLWAEGKNIGNDDRRFLDASQEAEKCEIQRRLDEEAENNQRLTLARQQAEEELQTLQAEADSIKKQVIEATKQLKKINQEKALIVNEKIEVEQQLKDASQQLITTETQRQIMQVVSNLDKKSVATPRRFQYDQVGALLDLMQLGQELQSLIKEHGDNAFSADTIYALQSILDEVENRAHQPFQRQILLGSYSENEAECPFAHYSGSDQRIIISCGRDIITIWDSNSQKKISTLLEMKDIEAARFMPNEDQVELVSYEHRKWRSVNIITGKYFEVPIQIFELSRLINRYADKVFTNTNKQYKIIRQNCARNQILVLDSKTGDILPEFLVDFDIDILSISPSNPYMFIGGEDGEMELWNISAREKISSSFSRGFPIAIAKFSPDGQYIVTATDRGTIKIWNADMSKNLVTSTAHQEKIPSLNFSSDSLSFITASWDGSARMWDTKMDSKISIIQGHMQSVNSAEFSPDSQHILTASDDNTARIWNAETGQLVVILGNHKKEIKIASFSPNGKYIVTACDTSVKIWDAATGKEIKSIERENENEINTAQFSSNSKHLLTLGTYSDHEKYYRIARVWELESYQVLFEILGDKDELEEIAYSPDGHYIVTGWKDGTAKIYDALGGNELTTLKGHQRRITALCFSSNGMLVATASWDKTVRIWNIQNGEEEVVIEGHEKNIFDIQFSPNCKYLVTASDDGTARIWETKTGKEISRLSHSLWVNTARFSPDGERIVTSCIDDPIVRIWHTKTGKQIADLKGHDWGVKLAKFSPDGKHVVTVSSTGDGIVRIWPVEDLDTLLARGCHWLRHYLADNPQILTKFPVCQTPEILQAALPTLLFNSERLAREGKLSEAIEGFTLAKQWNPQLTFDPTDYANQTLLFNSERLVREGKLSEAIEGFTLAKQWNPQLTFDPTDHANQIAQAAKLEIIAIIAGYIIQIIQNRSANKYLNLPPYGKSTKKGKKRLWPC